MENSFELLLQNCRTLDQVRIIKSEIRSAIVFVLEDCVKNWFNDERRLLLNSLQKDWIKTSNKIIELIER
jgi:hypothetical protein